MKRILLPTDFSENAFNAIRYALKLYEQEKCTFYLLNTYTPSAYFTGTTLPNSFSALQLEEIASNNSKKGLDETEARINEEFSNPQHIFVKLSSFNLLVSEIISLVRDHDIDLIVMGTKGATGAQEVFIGTQTMYTIKKAKCPVIAVPETFQYETPKEMLFVTDFKFDRDHRYLHELKELSEQHIARINILNVYYHEALTDEQTETRDFLDSYFAKTAHVFHTTEGVEVAEAVAEFQIKHKINFLVMIHNKHTFFENLLFKPVINQIAFHTNVPFLVIPSEKRIES